GAIVSVNFFEVLEVKPILGRAFSAADGQPGAPRVAVVREGLWRSHFGARQDLIGQKILLNDEPTLIVGVMPAAIDYPGKADVWLSPRWRVPEDPQLGANQDPSADRSHGYLSVIGRLKRGTTLEAGQADMDVVAAALERDYPTGNQDVGIEVVLLR